MNPSLENKKVCFVHDWLIAMRGGEKVLEAMSELFPEAPIYTLILDRSKISPALQKKDIRTSFLQWIPGVSNFYRWLLPLFPLAVRLMNVKDFDIVISSSHCVAKAARLRKNALHFCYCHTPMRYLWGFGEDYFGNFPKPVRWLIELYFRWLRIWDVETSKGVDFFIANSDNTAVKIKNLYEKEAKVIYPPVELPHYSVQKKQGDYFLIVSALVPYKRLDLAIGAFNQLKKPLRLIGDGPSRKELEGKIKFNGIQFEGWLDTDRLNEAYAGCRALIFPGEEDFGIVPVEAQGFGKPVIGYGKGGLLETVLPYNISRSIKESTGIFFYESNAEALIEAVNTFETFQFDPDFIRKHAQFFGLKRFQTDLSEFLASSLSGKE